MKRVALYPRVRLGPNAAIVADDATAEPAG